MDSIVWGCHPGQTGATTAPCPSAADEHGLPCRAKLSPMKPARRYQGPGRSQTILQSSALPPSKAVRPIELLAARKSVSKTSADDQEEATANRSYVGID